ncbi:hypothetical protein [Enterobacter asburiae]|uniref:hypothetical protein n=2 Tax=Enterobacter asburiae TaxID=61645 RepID=UPI0018B0BB6E|nr:hypothetical protein [Enterobacter asburiae]
MVHSESKRKGNLLLFGDFVAVAMNPWFDSESGHHYLKNPAYGWVFAFLRLYIPSLYPCFSLPWDRASALPDGGFAFFGLLSPQARQAQRQRTFLRTKQKTPHLTVRGFSI